MRRLLLLTFAILLSAAGCERTVEYRYASIAEIPSPSDLPHWQYVETLGTATGPFKPIGGHVLNADARGKRVFYTVGGSRVEKDLDLLQEQVLIERFVNPQGDSLVIIYKRRPAPA